MPYLTPYRIDPGAKLDRFESLEEEEEDTF
jgi:hypothetical protein